MSDSPLPEITPGLDPRLDPTNPLDIQHDTDPEHDHGIARRIPHLGHAVLFFFTALLCLVLCSETVFGMAHLSTGKQMLEHPGVSLFAQALSYGVTLAAAALLFPRLWEAPFLRGIQWHPRALRRRWWWLIPVAVALACAAMFADRFVPVPPSDNVFDKLLQSARGAWSLTAFGVLLAPLTEEVAFRGFLLPALATAYDWLQIERTPAGVRRWQTTTTHTTGALLFAAVFSSIAFALLHAIQLHYAWAAVGVLCAVSLALSAIRIRTQSLACSVLTHAAYNATLFAHLLIVSGGYRHLERLS